MDGATRPKSLLPLTFCMDDTLKSFSFTTPIMYQKHRIFLGNRKPIKSINTFCQNFTKFWMNDVWMSMLIVYSAFYLNILCVPLSLLPLFLVCGRTVCFFYWWGRYVFFCLPVGVWVWNHFLQTQWIPWPNHYLFLQHMPILLQPVLL